MYRTGTLIHGENSFWQNYRIVKFQAHQLCIGFLTAVTYYSESINAREWQEVISMVANKQETLMSKFITCGQLKLRYTVEKQKKMLYLWLFYRLSRNNMINNQTIDSARAVFNGSWHFSRMSKTTVEIVNGRWVNLLLAMNTNNCTTKHAVRDIAFSIANKTYQWKYRLSLWNTGATKKIHR
jgi:hypothetical protein